ncbi:MAG: helix-turn-helix domain-containing protein [Marvinbryantia sp.]|uniref:AraC family transcriptional regulator n=1 Tax=Marvinbryantia sp. TaxID=2496532 RepID=UPI0025F9C004|nr:AraC family transcriptional regulator [uncultured Marvinbryantia sp.]
MNPFYEQQKRNLRTAILDTLTFPEHLHAHTEFLYVMEGQTRVSVGNTSYDMKQGDCALIFPGLVHSYHASEPNRVWLLIFDTGVTASFQYLLQKFRPTCPYLPADQVSPDIALAVSRLDDMNMEENPALAAAWIQIILGHVLPHLELAEKKQPESEDLTYQLIHYLAEHFQEELSLDSLAKALHVNKYYLSHIFSEKLHISFPQYLAHLRVDYACNAMQFSEKSLTAIWAEAGFSSQRSFNRIFREIRGMSPLAYRKTVK